MEVENEPTGSGKSTEKGKKASRGRSKKRASTSNKTSKKKEPFGRIATGILPSAALASASPNAVKHVGKSRSPSPLARAVAFVGRVGHVIAAGRKLDRSLSVQELHRQTCSTGLAESKPLSKSQPGPSGFQGVDLDDDDHYESVREFKRGRLELQEEDGAIITMAGRPPMPLPEDAESKKVQANTADDMYAMVMKRNAVSRIDKLQKATEPPDDSDELTFVSEMDDDTPSRMFIRKGKQKPDSQVDDASEGPSDGEIYRLPFDAINNEGYSGIQFQTIEELENEEFSGRSKLTGDAVSPGSAHSKASSHNSGLPILRRAHSIQSIDSDHEQRLSRPQTPREMGREAALRRLEELGFDAIIKEFGMSNYPDVDNGTNDEQDGRVSLNSEAAVPHIHQSDFTESSPSFDDALNYSYEDRTARGRVSHLLNQFEPKEVLEKNSRNAAVVVEPDIELSKIIPEQSSHELMLDELVNESQSSDWLSKSESEVRLKGGEKLGKPEMESASMQLKDTTKNSSMHLEDTSDVMERSTDKQQIEIDLKKNDIEQTGHVTSGKVDQQKELQRSPPQEREIPRKQIENEHPQIGISRISQDKSPDEREMASDKVIVDSTKTTNIPLGLSPSSLDEQRKFQHEIKQKQNKIMDTISALETQFQYVANAVSPDKREAKDQEEKLSLLRLLIKEEQKSYHEQQKILEDQEQKIQAAQHKSSPRRERRPHSRFSNSPVSPRKYHNENGGRREALEQPYHFRMLEDRLKNVEAERQALLDLNSSLHDENDALKRLSLHLENSDTSGIVFKKQNIELTESNNKLKSLVHRLNIELSRYQAKYRPPRNDEVEGLSLPEEGPVPEWLVNIKYLSPLIMAYDDRIQDKNEVIRVYETHLESFKSRLVEIVRENQRLQMMVNEKSEGNKAFDEWSILQEQAKLVIDENAILMQEINLKDRRIDEIQDESQIEITKLTKRLRVLENEKKNLSMQLSSLQMEGEGWKSKYQEADTESKKKISKEEMKRRIEDMKRPLLLEIENNERNNGESSMKLQAIMKEKQELAVKLTDANGNIARLQLEVNFCTKTARKAEKKLAVLQRKFEAAREKEMIATETLNQVLSVAEESSKERDVFARLVESQNNETIVSQRQNREHERRMDNLKRELEKYKELAKRKAAEMSQRVKEKDDEISNLQTVHEKEISNLKRIIRERQKMLSDIQINGSQFENEIDILRKSITEENKEIINSLKS